MNFFSGNPSLKIPLKKRQPKIFFSFTLMNATLLSCIFLLTANIAYSANKTFTGPGIFSDTAKWDSGTLPAAGDNLWINGVCTFDDAAGNFAYGNLEISHNSAGSIVEWPSGGSNSLNIASVVTGSGGVGTIDMSNGGILQIRSGWTSDNTSLTPGLGTVEYTSTGIQTIAPLTYNNLTLAGRGAKSTFASGTTTVNGILSLEGSATVLIKGSLIYGVSAALKYNTDVGRNVGAEWISPFPATGGVIIANTGVITLNSAKVLGTSVPLTINNGSTFATGNRSLTFGGDFINNGTFIGGTASIVIEGTADTQNISGFITTGTVSMTKTSGTATFTGNVNGDDFTLNGNGGTLDLGAGLIHTFTGDWTRTNGSLLGNSSTLNIGGTATNTSGTFTAGTSTVNYNDSGAQTIADVSYNNLTLSGSGEKTFPAGTTTVNGTLSVGGTAGLKFSGSFVNNGGPINCGSASIEISGTSLTQNIAGFTTTGTVSMTKTAGTAIFTGNVNGGAFTLNGNGGTLDLGEGLTHTFTGTWTRTRGILLGNSSTLNLGGSLNGTGGTFSAGTSTVNYNAAGAQTIAGVTYNNLVTSGGGVKTLDDDVNVDGDLTIGNGTTLAAGNNALTLGGNFNNNGTFTAGNSDITITGPGNQSTDGFTTTGTVSMTKTAGTATFTGNINGGAFTLNGNGGTLDLGTGLTHTFTGAWSRINGALLGNSSTLNIGGTTTNTGGTFTAGTSTIVYNAAGAQTIADVTYNNLNLTGSGAKTFPAGTTTVNGILSVGGTAGLNFTGSLVNNGGPINCGSAPIEISGTSLIQSIAGFTTTGTVSMTKTAGTAAFTGNVNGDAFILNGNGGSLDLGEGLTHTFTGNWSRSKGTLIGSSSTLIIGGTTTTLGTGGTFDPGTSTVIYNGAAQTIADVTYNNLTLSGSGAKTFPAGTTTVNGTLSVGGTAGLNFAGSFVNNGGLINCGSAPIEISGTSLIQSIAGFTTTGTVSMTKTAGTATFTGNVNGGAFTLIGNGGTLDLGMGLSHTFTGTWTRTNGSLLGNSSTLNIGGTTTNTAGIFTAGTGTVNYFASGPQTLANVTYNNLTLSGTGIKTTTDVIVNGILSMEGTATASSPITYGLSAELQYNTASSHTTGEEWVSPFTATAGVTITNTGTITVNAPKIFNSSVPLIINSGAILDSGNFGLTLGGDFVNNGTFNAGISSVTFNGAAQIIGGSSITTFNNLTINNSNEIVLNNNVNVNGELALTAGKIKTGSYLLTVTSSGNISHTNGYIFGNLRKAFATGAHSFTFSIGDISIYAPVTLSFEDITTPGYVTANTTQSEHVNISTSGINPSKNVNRYWTLTPGGGIGYTTYSAAFTFDPADIDIGSAQGKFVVRRYNGSIWTSTSTGTRTMTATQANGISGMSDFSIGEQELDHFDFSLSDDQTDSLFFTGTNTLISKDFIGETAIAFDASLNNVEITSNPDNGTISGLGSGNNNVLNQSNDFTNGIAVLTGKLVFSGISGDHIFIATSSNSKTGESNTITIKGAVMQVKGDSLLSDIENGDSSPFIDDGTDYGRVGVLDGGKVEHTFKIKNPGFSNLKFTGTPLINISGPNAGDFTVTLQPSSAVAINDSTEFKVTFDPSGGGIRTALISIHNNDGARTPFEFSIRGIGDLPDIDILTKSAYIRNGYITPSLIGFTDFGTVKVGDSVAYIFVIRNSGAVPLSLTGTPFVEIRGANADDFVVTSQPSSQVIDSDDVGTFQLTFKPSADSLRTAVVTIKSNVEAKSPYTFAVQGTGRPKIEIISPNGTEKWFAGGENYITWSSKFIEKVKIEFSLDGGESWNLIASDISDSLKNYSWILPDTISTRCFVKISDMFDSLTTDRSDNAFSIRRLSPPLNLTAFDDPEDNGHRINLAWTLSEDDDIIDGYKLFRSRKQTFTEPVIDINSISSLEELIATEQTSAMLIEKITRGITEFSDNSVPLNGIEYFYWIQAYKGMSSSAKIQSGKITLVADETRATYSVSNPYPNPFNPVTTISFSVPNSAHVSFSVYSLAGQKVATLIDGMVEKGRHEVKFDGSRIASGVYFYRFESGGFSKTGKMLLMK